ncbi:hypothetical protein DV515_00009350, partial [Chloebia gouldiae]
MLQARTRQSVARSWCSPRTCRTPRQPPRAWARPPGREWLGALERCLPAAPRTGD